MAEKKTLQLVQVLRGIASLLVVLLHVTANMYEIFDTPFLGNVFMFGGSGVDVFFVLSGFIITYTSLPFLSKPAALPAFAKRRLNRIYPIYWIVITGLLLLQLGLPAFYNTHFTTSFSNLAATYLLLPEHEMLNGVSWSLTNELFFYFIFTVAFLLPKPRYSFYCMLLYFFILLAAAISFPQLPTDNAYLELLLFPMNIEFFLGVTIAILFKKLPPSLIYPFLLTGIALFITGASLYNLKISVIDANMHPEFERVLLFGVPSFFILLALTSLEFKRAIRVHPFLLTLGDASYSIYLVHLPLAVAALKIANRLELKGFLPLQVIGILIIVAVCAVGILVYRFIEKPLINKLNKAW